MAGESEGEEGTETADVPGLLIASISVTGSIEGSVTRSILGLLKEITLGIGVLTCRSDC